MSCGLNSCLNKVDKNEGEITLPGADALSSFEMVWRNSGFSIIQTQFVPPHKQKMYLLGLKDADELKIMFLNGELEELLEQVRLYNDLIYNSKKLNEFEFDVFGSLWHLASYAVIFIKEEKEKNLDFFSKLPVVGGIFRDIKEKLMQYVSF